MKTATCKWCETEFKYKEKSSHGYYCSNACQQTHKQHKEWKQWVDSGSTTLSDRAKGNLLRKFHGNKCAVCGIVDWNGKELKMHLDHINGNHTDNTLENCRLVCPNCDAQSDHYKGKNKGNGRYIRRIRYSEGKSY